MMYVVVFVVGYWLGITLTSLPYEEEDE